MRTQMIVTEALANAAPALSHELFYDALITRNRLVIEDGLQARIRNGKFLVAGCGSIGSSIVEPLIRLGAENIVIAEPDGFELSNLNRQQARIQDVGVNKGMAVRNQVREISPFAKVNVLTDGLTEDNLAEALNGVSVVFDGVDVTTQRPIWIKFRLHQEARNRGIPVISGYDIAGVQMLAIYRYDRPGADVLNGAVVESDFEKGIRPMDFLFKVVPLRYVPKEIFPALRKMLAGEEIGFPQVVYTARSYGNMALAAALEILEGQDTRKYVVYDHHAAVRPWATRVWNEIERWAGLSQLLIAYFKNR